jgi:hypothetical protein
LGFVSDSGSSHVDHWLVGATDPSRPLPSASAARAGTTGTRSCLTSLFRFEGATLVWGVRSNLSPVPLSGAGDDRERPRDHWSHAALENCRASTSIYLLRSRYVNRRNELPSYKEPTVDALAPDADEGRGRLRKATGSCLSSFDPWISEWGNPARVMPCHPRLNT